MSKLLTYNLLLIVIVLFIKSLIGGPYNDEYYKNLYIKRRKDVRNNRDCMTELERWKDKDNDYPYHYLRRGLIPKKFHDGTVGERPYDISDTIFSDYKRHHKELILSESSGSSIVANKESYDWRQYKEGKNTKEGQAFAHILVIPDQRIFNIVDPDATKDSCAVLKEMKEHFIKFWRQGGATKILARVKEVVEEHITPGQDAGKDKIWATYDEMSGAYENLEPDDFAYTFHPFPDASVGHLHMHVYPKSDFFRKYSTEKHDWKNIPLDVVLAVEAEAASKSQINDAD